MLHRQGHVKPYNTYNLTSGCEELIIVWLDNYLKETTT